MIKIGSLLTALHDSTPKYDALPFFVKKIFRAAGNTGLPAQDDSAVYRITKNERTLTDTQASGISIQTGLHSLVRHLFQVIPEDSTMPLLLRFGAKPAMGQTNRPALLFAIAHQFFRCVAAAKNEAENIIPEVYNRAVEHPSIMIDPSDNGAIALFANEVEGFCPLCNPPKKFTYKRDGSPSNFTTVRIFPQDLDSEDRDRFIQELGEEPESPDCFENRIAVCRECADLMYSPLLGHDLETSKRLREVKLSFIKKRKAQNDAYNADLGSRINEVLDAIRTKKVFDLPEDEEIDLTYDPVTVERKIPTDQDLSDKVTVMAIRHYENIRLHFYYLDKVQEGTFDETCDQVKRAYRIFSRSIGHNNQVEIFEAMVRWLNEKTFNDDKYRTACEVVISFFVQDCEVFVA